jgi:Leucine-rich repeat (LRR) protein
MDWFSLGEANNFIALISSSIVLLGLLGNIILKFRMRIVQHRVSKDLFPIYTEGDVRLATRYYISTQCQNIAPSQEYELIHSHAFSVKQKSMPFFLKQAFNRDKDNCRFYLILGDSGMGKTTFLINLYLRYTSPLNKGRYKMKIFPLILEDVEERIKSIPKQERYDTIILLDAFDENSGALNDYKSKLKELLDLVSDFREVVITCRTQFFPSEVEEPIETTIERPGVNKGFYHIRKIYISPFDNKDIRRYLNKKYGFIKPWNLRKKRKAHEIVKASPNLMVRPMLLSYIDDLLVSTSKYSYGYTIYKELINKWIDREASRVEASKRTKYKNDLLMFSKAVALEIYHNWSTGQTLTINAEDIVPLARKYNIMLSDLELKSRSLLNRDALGKYKFSHKSILEYFLADEIFKNEEYENMFNFNGMDQARKFFSEMAFEKVCIPYFIKKQSQMGINMKSQVDELYQKKYLSLNIENFNSRLVIGLPKLKKFELSFSSGKILISVEGNKMYEELRKIERLKLNNNSIKDISFLTFFPQLRYVDLSNNKIKDFSIIKKHKSLKEVHVFGNPINKNDLYKFSNSIPDCKILYN